MHILSRLVWVALLLSMFWIPAPSHAQENEETRVGFIVDNELQFASPNQPGPNGISRFASIFDELGAEILTIAITEPIPASIDVAILIGPKELLSVQETAYLYQYLQGGGRLLLAADPDNYADVNTEINRIGITDLFLNDYGITLQSNLLVEPWFTIESLSGSNLAGSQMIATPEDIIPHPITQPLLQYELPLQLWGGRSIIVEPFGVNSFGSALLYDDTAYGETADRLFRTNEPDPLTYTPEDDDVIGRLPIGAIGINTQTTSSIVLLGDSEMLLNGFGLDFTDEAARPIYPGNFLFAERLAAWLLNLSPANYPGLPGGFTWISIDGLANENPDLGVPLSPIVDNGITTFAVYNNHHLYMQITTEAGTPPTSMTFSITAEDSGTATPIGVTINDEPIPDAAFAADSVIEMRLPLRLFGEAPRITNLCLIYEAETRCQDERIIIPTELQTIDPVPMRITNTPIGTITSPEQINLRNGPGTQFDVIDIIEAGEQVAIIGKNATNEWVFVRTGAFEGWLATFLVPSNTSLTTLNVIEPAN